MTDDNLTEFLNERVLATRQVHSIDYPVDLDTPAVGVMMGCAQDAMTIVILPVVAQDLIHLEIHCFVDGERVDPEIGRSVVNGQWIDGKPLELTLRRRRLHPVA